MDLNATRLTMLATHGNMSHLLKVGGGMHGFGMHGFGMHGFGAPRQMLSPEFLAKLREKFGKPPGAERDAIQPSEFRREQGLKAGAGMLTKVPLPAAKQARLNTATRREETAQEAYPQHLLNPLAATLAEGAMSGHGYAYATRGAAKGRGRPPKAAPSISQDIASDNAARRKAAKQTAAYRGQLDAVLDAQQRLKGAGMYRF